MTPEGMGVSESSFQRLLEREKRLDNAVADLEAALERVRTAAQLIEDDEVREVIVALARFEVDLS